MRTLAEAYAHCEQVMQDKAKSFYFAMRVLPKEKRMGVYALYHFCRTVDDLTDERGERAISDVRADLSRLVELVTALTRGQAPEDLAWMPLYETIQRFDVPAQPLIELIEGVSLDLEPVMIRDTAELLRYCYLVAGVVGLMLGPVFGARGNGFKEGAIALGIAMQLTNILRDVVEDLERGRVYLPATELERFGLSQDDLRRGLVTPQWREFMDFQIERAHRYYLQGAACLPYFPNDGSRLATRVAGRVYGGILEEIERRDYDVFSGRASIGTPEKLMLLMKAVLGGPPAPSRPDRTSHGIGLPTSVHLEGVGHGRR